MILCILIVVAHLQSLVPVLKPIPKIIYLFWVKTDMNALRIHVPEFYLPFNFDITSDVLLDI